MDFTHPAAVIGPSYIFMMDGPKDREKKINGLSNLSKYHLLMHFIKNSEIYL